MLNIVIEKTKRFSTDIDILVPLETNIEGYIEEAGKLFPFNNYEQQSRLKRSGIEKNISNLNIILVFLVIYQI